MVKEFRKPDLVNALFNLGGALSISISIWDVYVDKAVSGVHWTTFIFFIIWSMWNLFFYSHLRQWYSVAAGILMVAAEVGYMTMLIYYAT